MKRSVPLLLVVLSATAFFAFASVAQAALFDNGGIAFGQHEVLYGNWTSWVGARAKLELRTGSMTSAEASAGGYVQSELKLYNTSAGHWILAGIQRSQRRTGSTETTFFWEVTNGTGNHYHYVPPSGDLDPDTYIGTDNNQQYAQVTNVEGTNNWRVRIAGHYAADGNGDYIASPGWSYTDDYYVRLETNAHNGHYGTSSNKAYNVNIQRTLNYGDSWGVPGSQYGQDGYAYDPDSDTHLGWTTRPQSDWYYRND